MATPAEAVFPLFSIRYEGGDAAHHQIDLNQLGESLQGFARILGVAANLLQTGRVSRHFDALAVQVLAVPTQTHRCHEVVVFIKSFLLTKEFFAGLGSGLLPALVAYVLSRRDNAEMKLLSAALQKQMDISAQANERVTSDLVAIIDKLADAMRPSVKKALAPVGRSCESVDLYAGDTKFHHMDVELKKAVAGQATVFSDHSSQFAGVISELDTKTGACKITLDGDEERTAGQILDPVYALPGNPYAEALASGVRIHVLAKAELDAEGIILKLHIFDTVSSGAA